MFRRKQPPEPAVPRSPLPRGLARVRAYADAWEAMAERAQVGTAEQQRLFMTGVPERDLLEAILELDERTR